MSRSHEIVSLNYCIALKFDRHIDSTAAEVKFQSDRTILVAPKLCKIWQKDVLSNIEMGPCEITLRLMLLDLTDDKPTLVQVMAWCCQAPSHYLSQCWPYSVTPPKWVNRNTPTKDMFFYWFISWWPQELFSSFTIKLTQIYTRYLLQ